MFTRRLLYLTILLPSAAWAQSAPPPLSVYARATPTNAFALSPDGEHVAFASRNESEHLIHLLSAGDTPPQIVKLGWAQPSALQWLDSSHLLLSRRQVVDEPRFGPKQVLTQGLSYNFHTGAITALLSDTNGGVSVLTGGPLSRGLYDGRSVIYMRGLSSGPSYSLYRVDLNTGRGALVKAGSLASERWVTTSSGEVVAMAEADQNHQTSYHIKQATGWRTIPTARIGQDVSLVGLGRTEGTLAFQRGPDLVEVSRADGAVSSPLQPAGTEVSRHFSVDSTGLLAAVQLSGEKPAYAFFDPRWKQGWESTLKAFPGAQVRLMDESDDGQRLIVLVENFAAAAAGAVYYVDLPGHRAELLSEVRPGLTADEIAQTSSFEFKASDGLALRGILTLPPYGPTKALPLVVLVHGGPSFHADLTFDNQAQALASRGYAVLKVNGRGASGVEERLQTAGYGQWGRKMQTDLSDGVAQLVRQGTADPHRVCIMGTGYGGYAALAGVSLQSGVYRCAVAIDAVVDLRAALQRPDEQSYGPSWGRYDVMKRYVGADTPAKVLADLSPAVRPERVSAPVLMVEDSLADQSELVTRMAKALKALNKPVEIMSVKAEDALKVDEELLSTTYGGIISFLAVNNPISQVPSRPAQTTAAAPVR